MTVYLQTAGRGGALGNANLLRKAIPQSRPTVTVPSPVRTSTPHWTEFGAPVLNPKKRTTDQPAQKVTGDPIWQLHRSANQRSLVMGQKGTTVLRHPGKRGDFEGFGDKMPIRVERETSRHRRRQKLAGEFREQVASMGGKVRLGTSGDGLAFMKSARVRPALPGGQEFVPRPTSKVGLRVGSLLHMNAPAGTMEALGVASQAHAETLTRPATLGLNPSVTDMVELSPVAVARASTLPGTNGAQEQGGRLLFMVAAVFVAYMVLK